MNAQAGMLTIQLKQVSEDSKFSKSLINGFQFKNDKQDRIVVVSQSATIIDIEPDNGKKIIISSANYLLKYFNQQHGMTYQQMRNQPINYKVIMENCRFFLVKRKGDNISQEYLQEDFEKLRLLKILKVAELEKDLQEFMSKNSLELEYSQQGVDDTSSEQEYLRSSSFLVFQYVQDNFSLKDQVKVNENVITNQQLLPQQKVINICSPFGLNAKELFLNISYKAIITNKISDNLYLTDLDGHLVNVEGSPIFDKKTGQLIGIRLPNFHTYNLYMSCSLFVPINLIMQSLFNLKTSQLPTNQIQNKSFQDLVVKLRDSNLNSSGVLIDSERGLILTNSHCIDSVNSQPKVRIDGVWFKSRVIAKAKEQETIDVCLLQVTEQEGYLALQNNPKHSKFFSNKLKFDLSKQQSLREGDPVYSVGYGFYQDLVQPSIYGGYILRVVQHKGKQLFIQHTAKTYAGQSGGGLFDKHGNFIGLLFKNSILTISEDKTIKLQLDKMCTAVSAEQLKDLFTTIHQNNDTQFQQTPLDSYKNLEVFNCSSDRVKELQRMLTTKLAPEFTYEIIDEDAAQQFL